MLPPPLFLAARPAKGIGMIGLLGFFTEVKSIRLDMPQVLLLQGIFYGDKTDWAHAFANGFL